MYKNCWIHGKQSRLIRRHTLQRLIRFCTFFSSCYSNMFQCEDLSTYTIAFMFYFIVYFRPYNCQKRTYHYENMPIQIDRKFHLQKLKKKKNQIKNTDIFHITAQNIDCGYSLEPPLRGGSNEYPQSMFLSRNKKNNVYPCKPQFYYINVGFKGINII